MGYCKVIADLLNDEIEVKSLPETGSTDHLIYVECSSIPAISQSMTPSITPSISPSTSFGHRNRQCHR